MNMIKLLLCVFAIQFTLIICGVIDIPGSALYNFITNPSDWSSADFLGIISSLFLAAGGVAIIAGTIITRSDIFIFAGLAGILLSFGIGLAELWSIVAAQTNATLATILVSPIILIYVMTAVAWWRNGV